MTACFSTRHSTVTAVLNFHFSLPFFFLFYFSVFKTVALEFSLNTHTHTHTHTRSRLKGVKHEVTSHFLPLCSFPFFFSFHRFRKLYVLILFREFTQRHTVA